MPKISATTIAEHKALTWSSLLDAMDALVLERPFESITLRDVSERSGVARTAIYNYVPDTLTLLTETAKRGSTEVIAAVEKSAGDTALPPSERLREIITVLLTEFAHSTRAFLAVQSIEQSIRQEPFTSVVIPARDLIGGRILDVVRAGVQAGEFAPLSNPDLTRALMVGVMQAALRRGYSAASITEDEAAIVAQFITDALRGPVGTLP